MKKSDAIEIVSGLIFTIQKIRSNVYEALGENNAALNLTYPELFDSDGKSFLLEYACAVRDKGEHITPIDLYNLLFLCNENPTINAAYSVFAETLPEISPLPAWLSGWEDEAGY